MTLNWTELNFWLLKGFFSLSNGSWGWRCSYSNVWIETKLELRKHCKIRTMKFTLAVNSWKRQKVSVCLCVWCQSATVFTRVFACILHKEFSRKYNQCNQVNLLGILCHINQWNETYLAFISVTWTFWSNEATKAYFTVTLPLFRHDCVSFVFQVQYRYMSYFDLWHLFSSLGHVGLFCQRFVRPDVQICTLCTVWIFFVRVIQTNWMTGNFNWHSLWG